MLKNLELENFRNHKKIQINLEKLTVIMGKNGIGKTNILEAVAILSFCRSFRGEQKRNVINEEAEYARVRGDESEVFLSRFPRLSVRAKINSIPRKVTDFIGTLPVVIFSPETIDIITGSPGERRRFLDMMLSQVNKEYLVSLVNFKKIRQQRNSLLQKIKEGVSSPEELSFWDNKFVCESEIITRKREEAISFLNKYLSEFYQTISGEKADSLELNYIKNYKINLKEELISFLNKDIAYGGTILGPHRDDVEFKLNRRCMANFASRGEVKSAILALKLGELNYINKINKKKKNTYDISYDSILLLDDIFSEFDEERREHLIKIIADYQSIITTTDKKNLPEDLLKRTKIIEL